MTTAEQFYDNFLVKFIRWAESKNDIRAAFVVGSRARADYPADDYSDLDLMFFCLNQSVYLSNTAWLHELGSFWALNINQNTGGDPELQVVFEGGYEVDFIIHSADILRHMVLRKCRPKDFLKGSRYIIDKDGVAKLLMPSKEFIPPLKPMTEEQFFMVVHQFWFVALITAKMILRDGLWLAKSRDADLKALLLQVVEWHESAVRGKAYIIWDSGRYINQWASMDIMEDIKGTYGLFDREDSWRALEATIGLFKRLSCAVADTMCFEYPTTMENEVLCWIREHASDELIPPVSV